MNKVQDYFYYNIQLVKYTQTYIISKNLLCMCWPFLLKIYIYYLDNKFTVHRGSQPIIFFSCKQQAKVVVGIICPLWMKWFIKPFVCHYILAQFVGTFWKRRKNIASLEFQPTTIKSEHDSFTTELSIECFHQIQPKYNDTLPFIIFWN